ncbi:bifunctional 4-hydroxy-2-oxoglutarate aldolase/2-dehydro-3-deoxy-phosphogluconate aldolase [Fervidobacterium sp.]
MSKTELLSMIEREKFIAILRTSSTEEAIEKGAVVYEEGGKLIEVTFTVPNAEDAIEALKSLCPDAYIGAGTVINAKMCEKAIEAGAQFVVSPNFDPKVSKLCIEREILYIPGVMTPTEIVKAIQGGNYILKLFPGEVLGPVFVKAMKGPFPEVKFVATGGVTLDNLEDWFKEGVLAVGLGGSLVKGTREEVKERVKNVLNKIKAISKS